MGHQKMGKEVGRIFISIKFVDFNKDHELSLCPVVMSHIPFNMVEKLVLGVFPPKHDLSNSYKESTEYAVTIRSLL